MSDFWQSYVENNQMVASSNDARKGFFLLMWNYIALWISEAYLLPDLSDSILFIIWSIPFFKDYILVHFCFLNLCNLVCRYVRCNFSDLAPECPNPHDSRYFPERILLYDRHPGGTGVSKQVTDMKMNWLLLKGRIGLNLWRNHLLWFSIMLQAFNRLGSLIFA